MSDTTPDPNRSSVAVGGGGSRRGRSKLPFVLGLLAVLFLVLSFAVSSCAEEDGVDQTGAVELGGIDATAPGDAETGADSDPAPTSTPAAAVSSASGASGASGGDATLTAGGDSLLEDPTAIADHVGEDAEGAEVRVLSVEEAGFFVGTSEEDQQYVEFGGDVGEDESDQQLPEMGDVVELSGEVRPAPQDPARTLDLDEEQARLVEERGAYVNATGVTPAG